MSDSSLLYIPIDESILISKDTLNEDSACTSKLKLLHPPEKKSLILERKDTLFKEDPMASNKKIPAVSINEKQEMNVILKNNGTDTIGTNFGEEKNLFDDKVQVFSENEMEKAICKKTKNSPENQTTEKKVFLQIAAQEILSNEENSENIKLLQIVDHETTSRKRKRSFTRRSTRQQVLMQNKKNQINLQKKRKISTKQSMIKNADKQSVKKNLIKHKSKKNNLRRPREVKPVERKQISSRKKKNFIKLRGKIEDITLNNEKASTSKANFSISKIRKNKRNYTDPIFHEPFKYGWKREVVYRAYSEQSRADVYYYTPEGQKLRSLIAIKKTLDQNGLTIANFTFQKESVGIHDSDKEIIRHSTRAKKCITMTQKIKRKLLKTKKNQVSSFQEDDLFAKDDFIKSVSDKNNGLNNINNKIMQETNVESSLQDELDTQTKDFITIFEKEIGSLSGKKSFSSCEGGFSTTLITADKKTSSIEPDFNKITVLNNLHDNFYSNTSITNDSTQKVESLPDVLHVQSSSTYPGTMTTTIETSERCSPTKTRKGNVEYSDIHDTNVTNKFFERNEALANDLLYNDNSFFCQDNVTIITKSNEKDHLIENNYLNFKTRFNKNTYIEPEYFKDNFNQIENNLIEETSNKVESKSHNNIEKDNDSFYQNTLPTSIEAKIGNFIELENISIKDVNNVKKMLNVILEDQFFSKCGSAMNKEIDKTSESEKVNLNHQITQAKIIQLHSENSDQSRSEAHQSALLPKIVAQNNTEINKQITFEKKTNSFINSTLPKTVLRTISIKNVNNKSTDRKSLENNFTSTTPIKQNNPSNLNSSPFRRIKFNLPQTSVQSHSIVSFCAGYSALKLIFSYLNIEDLLIAKKVCKVWKEFADQSILFKKVQINNSQMADALVNILQKQATEYFLVIKTKDNNWEIFINDISKIKNQIIRVLSIKHPNLGEEHLKNLDNLQKLHMRVAMTSISLESRLTCLSNFIKLTHLSLKSIKDLGKKNIEVIRCLQNLKILELGECSGFNTFGSTVLIELKNLKCLKLESIQDSHCCFDILHNVSKLEKLTDLELINIDITVGFDEYLSKCQNITRLMLIPIYECQSALSNNIILKSTTKLTSNLKHFIWGMTEELLQFSKLFFDQSGDDWIPFLKPIPHYKLLEKLTKGEQNVCRGQLQMIVNILLSVLGKEKYILNTSRLDMLSLTNLQKLYAIVLPETKFDILKIMS